MTSLRIALKPVIGSAMVVLGLAAACGNESSEPGTPHACYQGTKSGGLVCVANASAASALAVTDVDTDGKPDTFLCPSGDEDGDDVADVLDSDDDNDGVDDQSDADETDGDDNGVEGTDADNDNVDDGEECETLVAEGEQDGDLDEDSLNDGADNDDDNDGLNDDVDDDQDGDGQANDGDIDDDNDGVPDVLDAH